MTDRQLAMLLPNLRGDGAVGMMLTLAEGLSRHGYVIDLLATRAEGERARTLPPDVRLIDLGATRPLRAVPAIVRYLRRSRPAAMLASEHYSGLPALYALQLAGVSTRCIIRQDSTWSRDIARTRGRHRVVTPWMVGRLFRRAEIVAVSHGVATDFVRSFPRMRNNVTVIYNPIVSDRLVARASEPLDHPWFQPGQPPVLVAAGRLQTVSKGFDVLIDAFAQVVKVAAARLLILGDGPDRAALQERIDANDLRGSCELGGYQPNPYPYMARARAFVLSSRFEGLPTVLVEALAVGTSVIATDCPSGPREILDNGAYGRMVPVDDVAALAAAIIAQLAESPRLNPQLGDWLQQFEVQASIDRHARLIEAALAGPPPNQRHSPLDIQSYGHP